MAVLQQASYRVRERSRLALVGYILQLCICFLATKVIFVTVCGCRMACGVMKPVGWPDHVTLEHKQPVPALAQLARRPPTVNSQKK